MIHPDDIHLKALKLYPAFLRAWLAGKVFFPRTVPCEKNVAVSMASAIESIQRLRAGAKETRGFGYSVEWEERNSRSHGRNSFPRKIVFETEEDFLRSIGKEGEFARFRAAVEKIRERFPALDSWIGSHRQQLADSAGELNGLLEVVDYLRHRPRPEIFARELPLSGDTKFVERNRLILREWLDIVLPPHSIRADEEHFHRRYGLRYPEPLVFIRFLDEDLQRSAGSPWSECSVPLRLLGEKSLNPARALIVENKVNLLTLPPVAGTLAIGGLGNGVVDLRYVQWMSEIPLWYWGDIDTEGFAILSRLRVIFPHVLSLFMDNETVRAWRERIGSVGTQQAAKRPSNLTSAEAAAFQVCLLENLRIEQERFPQSHVVESMKSTFDSLVVAPPAQNAPARQAAKSVTQSQIPKCATIFDEI
jgi:hypothetical protein